MDRGIIRQRITGIMRVAFVLLLLEALLLLVGVISARTLFRVTEQAGEPCIQLFDDRTWTGECPALVTDTPIPPTDTPIPPMPTATLEPTPTLAPTNTATPVPPTETPTPEPTPAGHDTTSWHPPGDGMHHGYPVTNTQFADLWLANTGQTIAYPWLSSDLENQSPYPGKHAGFIGLYEADTGCDNFGGSNGDNCIRSYFLMVHSLGTVQAIDTRIHSFGLATEVCTGINGEPPCGFVFTGGHHDYGVTHNGYKTAICQQDADPPDYPYFTQQGLNQPPYKTGHTTTFEPPRNDQIIQLWNTLINRIMLPYYPHSPNYTAGVAWSSDDAWQYPSGDPDLCDDLGEAVDVCPDGSCDLNHTRFQVFTLRLRNLPDERPFSGWTDVNGHVDPSCTETSAVCIPLVIDENVPLGTAFLNRSVDHGGDTAPIQDFDDGTALQMPGYTPEVNIP